MNSYSILLITRNGLEYTRRCLKSIELERPNILVIDNGSTDGTQRYLRTQHSMTVCTGTFNSLAACWNWGLSALFTRHSHVLVINNDTELLPKTAATLLEQMEPNTWDEEIGILSGVSVHTPKEMRFPPMLTSSPHPDFSCFMLSKSCFESVGKFDEGFLGAYCEDCDYHIRMHRRGWRAYSINLPFLHHGCGTLKTSDEQTGNMIRDQAEQNRERLESKWGVRPGTEAYNELFTEEIFGSDSSRS